MDSRTSVEQPCGVSRAAWLMGRRWLGIGRSGCVAHLLSHAVSKRPCVELPGSRHWFNRTSERTLTHMAQTRHLRHGPSTFARRRRHEPRTEGQLHAIDTIFFSTQNVLGLVLLRCFVCLKPFAFENMTLSIVSTVCYSTVNAIREPRATPRTCCIRARNSK